MFKQSLLLLICSSILAAPAFSKEEYSRIRVGAGVESADFQLKNFQNSSSFNNEITFGPHAFISYHFNQHFGIETAVSKADDWSEADWEGDFNYQGASLTGLFAAKHRTGMFIRAKAGLNSWRVWGYTVNNYNSQGEEIKLQFKENGVAPIAGISVGWQIHNRVEIALEKSYTNSDAMSFSPLTFSVAALVW